ncbi:MAG: VWA domain-containing protein [Acidobacteria bacterium]|nr:VWA domain-containing protein [Acidobacteriota bacterium]
MWYGRAPEFLSPLLIAVFLSGLLFGASSSASPVSAQSRSKRGATARNVRRKPTARAKPRRAQTEEVSPTTTAAESTSPGQAETGAISSDAAGNDGVRADLPEGGALRVENRRGGVRVEVWGEKHVSVEARVGGREIVRSPVRIQRTESLLTIGVVRASRSTAPARIDLILRIPERSRAEIVTAGGEVSVSGLPASLTVQTAAGDITAELTARADADVTAETRTGSIDSTLATVGPTGRSERDFQATLGAGGKAVELRSQSGSITLSTSPSHGIVPATSVAVDAATSSSAPSQTPRAETQREDATETGRTIKPPTLGGGNATTGAGTPASASGSAQEVDEGDIVRVDTELVTLNVSVVGRGTNRGLANLTQKDFKLYEDGAEQEIAHFDSSAAPFNLVLLIDLSGSTHEVVNIIRNAALRFITAARPADRIAVVTFANAPVIVSRLTNDREALRRRINSIEEPRGSTKVYDSIAYTMDEVLKDAGPSRRNAIVLMSDGLDSTLPNVTGDGSTIEYRELLGRIQELDGVLYSLWLNTEYPALSDLDVQPETVDLAHDRMKEMAEAGGGMFYEVEKLEDLAGAYERVVADLGTVYSLGYRPTNRARDGKWRAIRVAVARPDAVARGKRGYYAN